MTNEWTIDQIREFVKKDYPSVSARMVKCLLQYYDESPSKEGSEAGVLVEALEAAVLVIKGWHNADEVWDIYYNKSPEMKPIREVLATTQPVPSVEQEKEQDENWKDVISFIFTRKIKGSMNPFVNELKQSYIINRKQ